MPKKKPKRHGMLALALSHKQDTKTQAKLRALLTWVGDRTTVGRAR